MYKSSLTNPFIAQFLLEYSLDYDAAWTFSSVTVRIAQKLGFHRDGEHFNLTPFETEMGRRIWWQVARHESRLALLSGRQPLLPSDWDTKPPQNINDADMFPDSSRPIIPREGPTEMAFVLLLDHVYTEYISNSTFGGLVGMDIIWQYAMDACNGKSTDQNAIQELEKARSEVEKLSKSLRELEAKYVNVQAGVVHSAALTIRPLMITRLAEICVPMKMHPEWGVEITEPKHLMFKITITGFEMVTETYERMAPLGFAWSMKLCSQLDMVVGMTRQMCENPTGSLADRAWCVLGKMYLQHPEFLDMSQKRSTDLAKYTLLAWKVREQSLTELGVAFVTPPFVFQFQTACRLSTGEVSEQQPLMPWSYFGSSGGWNMGSIDGHFQDVIGGSWSLL